MNPDNNGLNPENHPNELADREEERENDGVSYNNILHPGNPRWNEPWIPGEGVTEPAETLNITGKPLDI